MTASLIIDFAGKNHLQDIYVTGILVVAVVAVIVLLGYLVWAKEPDGEVAFIIVLCGMLGAVGWPAVVVGGLLTGLVLGLRWVFHSSPALLSGWRSERRQRQLAEAALRSGLGRKPIILEGGARYRIKEDPTADYVAGRIEIEEFEQRVAKQLEGERPT